MSLDPSEIGSMGTRLYLDEFGINMVLVCHDYNYNLLVNPVDILRLKVEGRSRNYSCPVIRCPIGCKQPQAAAMIESRRFRG